MEVSNPTALIFLLYLDFSCLIFCQKTSHTASFQTGIEGSFSATSDVWMESSKQIPSLKEFTVCHWIKVKFYNIKSVACLWSYCTVQTGNSEMECLQVCLGAVDGTLGRNLFVAGYLPLEKKSTVTQELKDYRHRTWTHLCWSFSTLTGISQFFHDGILLGTHSVNISNTDLAMRGAQKMYDTALIFGQEPDIMRDEFDNFEAYLGELCEFNIWSYILTNSNIMEMASCKRLMRGNVLSWNKTNWDTTNILIQDLSDPNLLCSTKRQYFLIPEKLRYLDAKKTCEIHGGYLAIPKSEEENSFIVDIVIQQKEICGDPVHSNNRNLMWIGAEKWNDAWYKEDSSTHTHQMRLNYTKVTRQQSASTSHCSYLRNDGSWWIGQADCKVVSLCSVCEIVGVPVFTLKGTCSNSEIDWNYYLSIDDKHRLQMYAGYKKLDIVYDNGNDVWRIRKRHGIEQHITGNTSNSRASTKYPIGRKTWFIDDPLCEVDGRRHNLTFSICNFPYAFTCNSGHCIDLNKRCDEQKDCLDGSDEEVCDLLSIPSSYNRANAPKAPIEKDSLEIEMNIQVVTIDSIDTVNMEVTLTIAMQIKWYDKRLTFFNLITNKNNFISNEKSSLIWTPLRDIIHENAIIGEITNGFHSVKPHPSLPEDVDDTIAIENRSFNGSSNALELTHFIKVKYNCIFNVKNFPFDSQTCKFYLKLNQNKDEPVSFLGDGTITYEGPSIVGAFSIGKMFSTIQNTNESTKYIIVLPMSRIFANQLLITFIPTVVLRLFGYLTLFIEPDEDGFSNRFMGAGTALLVITTLFNAVNDDLPTTSYLKFVDFWFVWHAISIFIMIAFHICLDRLRTYLTRCNEEDLTTSQSMSVSETQQNDGWVMVVRINKYFIFVFAWLSALFYVIYFILTT